MFGTIEIKWFDQIRTEDDADVSSFLAACNEVDDCYDPLDPEGNITVTFDIYQRMDDAYLAKITIENYYQYRQVDKPGWKLGWVWANDEVIWSMSGAFATDKGNCSSYTFETPHSCKKNPVIAELGPDAAPENRSEHCCHGGLLSAGAVDPFKSFTSFDLKVGRLGNNSLGQAPNNLTFMDGYSCGPFLDTSPTVSLDLGGQRKIPAMSKFSVAYEQHIYTNNRPKTSARNKVVICSLILTPESMGFSFAMAFKESPYTFLLIKSSHENFKASQNTKQIAY
ncbi:hypothetical protein L6164_033319 [Bauhinia variegata]|uniref:Uncharacterized protein n=1 Tax=Bauhinia variegata TaxID=167791 RepID=A0ACB9KRR5_BAUVA|nr:hypothetical protein L6164_033319 [Bauhinia variegata]